MPYICEEISREDKGFTHLVHNNKLAAKELILEKCKEYLIKQSHTEWKDFVLGYFSHIYTDLRWTDTIYYDFENNYKGEMKDIRKTYNDEVSQIEFNLLRSIENSDTLFIKLIQARGYEINPFVTQDEVHQYRDSKVNWLQDPKNEPQIVPKYFTNDRVDKFISETSKEWKELAEE